LNSIQRKNGNEMERSEVNKESQLFKEHDEGFKEDTSSSDGAN